MTRSTCKSQLGARPFISLRKAFSPLLLSDFLENTDIEAILLRASRTPRPAPDGCRLSLPFVAVRASELGFLLAWFAGDEFSTVFARDRLQLHVREPFR